VLHPEEGQFKAHGDECVFVDPDVARSSTELAVAMFPFLREVGVDSVRQEMGGNTNNTGQAYVVSALSRVPVVLIENDPGVVMDDPAGGDRVADAITKGIQAYFRGQ
jgi:hypothetical protein